MGQSFKIKNCPSHYKIVSSRDFREIAFLETEDVSLRQLRGHLKPTGIYLFTPFPLLSTKSKGSDEKSAQQKNCIKNDHKTNVIATNFV